MICPDCHVYMIRRKSKFSNTYWWGCPNWPECNLTCAEHPDGSLASIPISKEVKELRKQAHRIAELIWGKWDSKECDKKKMYAWLEATTSKGHFGKMNREELIEAIQFMNRDFLSNQAR